jgi:hypothetical protein
MFARRVYMHLKPNSVAEFTQRLEKDILPLLRKQKGFQDEITFVGRGGTEAFAISLWDKAENAETYNRGTYPEVTKILVRPSSCPAEGKRKSTRDFRCLRKSGNGLGMRCYDRISYARKQTSAQ